MTSGSAYRPELDGLRAIAVLPVVLHHAKVPGFGGGFVGVDVFFVISGFLIAQQLLLSAGSGGISITAFYERRVRRIAPALLALLVALLLGGLIAMPAEDLLRESKNALATLAFASNILYVGRTGYFADSATEQVLLHTWSLAVEEQFYLIFPVLLIGLIRWQRLLRPALWTLAALSFVASAWLVRSNPDFAFYMLPSRGWELLVGALLAAGAIPAMRSPSAREAAAVIGVGLIAVAVLLYTPTISFPGIAAVVPVVGAMLVIHGSAGTRTAWLLSGRLPVGIGLISYSLYLWHWPVQVLAGQYLGELDALPTGGAVLVSLALGYASWRWVETPLRNRRAVSVRRLLLICGLAVAVVLGLIALVIGTGGLPRRVPAATTWYVANANLEHMFQTSPCLNHGAVTLPPVAPCLAGLPGTNIRVAVWGDSHALHWRPLFDALGRKGSYRVRMITKAGCPPFPVAAVFPRDQSRIGCPAFNAAVLDELVFDPYVDTVVLAANWQGVAEGFIRLSDTAGSSASITASRALGRAALARMVATLHANGKRVVAIGQTPVPTLHPIRCVGRRRALGLDEAICATFPLASALRRDADAAALLAGVGLDANVSPLAAFCGRGVCRIADRGHRLYIDAAHLSPTGALLLEPFASPLGRFPVNGPAPGPVNGR